MASKRKWRVAPLDNYEVKVIEGADLRRFGMAGEQGIDFTTFILSLVSSAQVHLGMIPNPVTGKAEMSHDAARQTIDIISILKDKTKGNLTKDEERLLEYVLYDLRMKYVEISKK